MSISMCCQVGNVGLTLTEQKSHFSLWCMAGAPLLAGTDIEHATAETLQILTAPELLEVNQDLGVGGALQAKNMGSLLLLDTAEEERDFSTTSTSNAAIVAKCDSKAADQVWDLVDAKNRRVVIDLKPDATGPPLDTPLWIRQKSSGLLLDVPKCAHAAVPRGPGPRLDVVKAPITGEDDCGGKNLLWQMHANGTITTAVDGQCINAAHGKDVLQTFSCETQGMEANGQWHQTATGQLQIASPAGHCLSVGAAPPPAPAPSGTGSKYWVKPMSDGKRTAVLLLNLGDNNATDLTVSAAQLNLSYSSMAIRDLWARKDLGAFSGNFTAKAVPAHGVFVFIVSEAH
jgi:hypothetical protein